MGACPGPNGHRSITGDERGRRRVRLQARRRLWRMREKRRGGAGAGAHGGCDELLSGLGGGQKRAGRRRRSRRQEVEDELDEDVRGPPTGRGSVRQSRKKWRSFWARRRGVGEAVAAVVASGGDEPVRVGERERSRGGDEHGGEREGVEGSAWLLRGRPGRSGKQEVAGVRGRALLLARWRRRLAAPVSWAGADGSPGKWPR